MQGWVPRKQKVVGSTIVVVFVLIFVIGIISSSYAQARPTIGLVLGGGSARGLSHIGLLKALEEGGIPIDHIVGTSMGSVIAGLYAAGLSADNLEYMVTNVNIAQMFVPTIPPKGGFLSTERFKAFINTITQNARMETLPIPFHTVVINLETGEETTLSTGSLTDSIVASMSIPAMFPPVRIGDSYYVDGGMKSLVPVEVAKEVGADIVIAVDVRKELDSINHDTVLSNVQLTLLFLLATDTPADLELADIVIAPSVASDSYMDYDRGEYFIGVGYEAAKAVVPQIQEALRALDPDFPLGHDKPQFGYSNDEFAARFREAVAAAESVSLGPSISPRMALAYDGDIGSEFDIVVPFAHVGEGTPIFAAYASQSGFSRARQSVSLGLGNCQRLCASSFVRRGQGENSWGMGAAIEGRVRGYLQYQAEWEGSGAGAGSWRVSLKSPDRVEVVEPQGEMQLTLYHDARHPRAAALQPIHAEVRYRQYFPWNRKDFWEAVSTSTNWYVGLGAQGAADENGTRLSPIGELGIAFEARLFGLYPLRSRVSLEYVAGASPWSIRWTLGEW